MGARETAPVIGRSLSCYWLLGGYSDDRKEIMGRFN